MCPEGRTPKAGHEEPKSWLRQFVGFASEERGYKGRHSISFRAAIRDPQRGVLVALRTPDLESRSATLVLQVAVL